MTNDNLSSLRYALTFLMTLAAAARLTQAAPIEFTIDEAKSKITLDGKVANFSLQPQGAGSLTTSFAGKILADVGATNIQFKGGSAIVALTNGVWQPAAGGKDGSAPANYAGQASVPFLGTAKGALRNLLLDLTSSALPLNNGQFDAGGLIFGFPAASTASFDYSAFGSGNAVKLSGLSTNKIVNGASVTNNAAGAPTLTIAIDTQFFFGAISDNDSSVRLTGTLVAVQATTVEFELTSIEIKDGKVIIHSEGGGTSPGVEVSTDLKKWDPATGTSTQEPSGGTSTTIALGGTNSFYRLSK